MIKKCGIILVLVFLINTVAFAYDYSDLNHDGYGKVMKVIDGDSMVVQMLGDGRIVLIKISEIDSKGYDDAVVFLETNYLGKQVYIRKSAVQPEPESRWNYAYVSYNGSDIGTKLVKLGYANAVNKGTTTSDYYATLETDAKVDYRGMWGEGYDGGYVQLTNTININTAGVSEITKYLIDVDSSLASDIVKYRDYNPFNTIGEVKFVDGFTKDIFDKNRNLMHVSTNLNTAYAVELHSLLDLSQKQVDKIIDFRKDEFIRLSEIRKNNLMTSDQYYDNEPFISSKDVFKIYYTYDKYTVNINTGTATQMNKAGLSTDYANKIISMRGKGYSFKTLSELNNVSGISFTRTELDKLEDNINVLTDLNNCSVNEINSLFGSNSSTNVTDLIVDKRPFDNMAQVESVLGSDYKKIKDYIYLDNIVTDYVNINTASRSQLASIGLDSAEIAKIMDNRDMDVLSEIPSGLSSYDSKMSIFTNINTAGEKELLSLHPDLGNNTVSKILVYRNNQAFGDIYDVKEFFYDLNLQSVYNDIDEFIVVR